MSSNQARAKEAEECMRKAEKYLKTSLLALKFSPDHDSAAAEFERAAVCFKNAQMKQQARDAYLRAAEQHALNHIDFHDAKCKEQAAILSKDLGELEKAKELMLAASQLYAETGTPETSAMALEKAAKFFEQSDPELAIQVYHQAYEVVRGTDKTKQQAEFLRHLTKLYMRSEKYMEATQQIRKEVELWSELKDAPQVGRSVAGQVLVHLYLGDSVEATKCLSVAHGVSGFERTEEANTLDNLIHAFENCDEEKWKRCMERPGMRAMDNEYLRLMKKMKCPSGGDGEGSAARTENEPEDENDLR